MEKLRDYEKLKKSIERFAYLKQQGTIEWEDEMLWFFAENYISIWYNGQSYAEVSQRKEKPIVTPLSEIKGNIYGGSRHEERRNQHKIAHRYMPTPETTKNPCVVGVEFSIPQRIIPDKPETDLLIVDRDKATIHLTEYKCSYESAYYPKSNIQKHYQDMKSIQGDEVRKKALRKICEVCYCLYTDQPVHSVDFSNYDVKISYLFTDLQGISQDCANDMENMLLGTGDHDILIWDFAKAEDVDFSVEPIKVDDFHFKVAPARKKETV